MVLIVSDFTSVEREEALSYVRAALESLREPDGAMLGGARNWSRVYVGTPIGNEAAEAVHGWLLPGAVDVLHHRMLRRIVPDVSEDT